MKVLREEITPRYYVELDEAETAMLKRIQFLSPHAEAQARLWVTSAERIVLEELLERTAAVTARASRACVKCGDTFTRGPTGMDQERFNQGVCGGCGE